MHTALSTTFDSPEIAALLHDADTDIDELDFGVIGFDAEGYVRSYNRYESDAAGLVPARVIGHHLFEAVAPCMNNFLVAQRFEDALDAGTPLDVTVDYVLTLRMRPVKVKLRLVATAGQALRHVLVQRKL